ncbi:hypothetical protein SAMN04244553_1370 [Nocardia amikacinitolerans]|uniref:DUF8020 domain-containing protein n=1 Tax=Nocardia amikacinitolerans TaxID=756689 RepID=A0A285L1F1_9NOCA|nr:hypothetical protein [Nocardia amikacinitolerans]MCP2279452.1 hypothetical protein [Nocardia amikacinitolerans]MCP2296751.1 hypothetical protein [Nocardia amikacinitolerans]SNY78715.1 hypothetical protein SAMN04244553_1370 [Nocardia amikacinitolerans]
MKVRKSVASAAIGVAALTVCAGTVHAEPLSVDVAPGVNYTAYQDGNTAVITVDAGQLIVDKGRFQIRADDGTVLAGVPLEFNVNNVAFPIDVQIDKHTARLTPSLDPARAEAKPVALPFQDQAPWKTPYDREVAAFSRMAATITVAGVVGGLVGAVGAGVIGCLVGGVTLAAATSPLAMMFGAGPVVGCLIGAGALAPVGALTGALFVGAPVATAAVIQYFTTINEPFPVK